MLSNAVWPCITHCPTTLLHHFKHQNEPPKPSTTTTPPKKKKKYHKPIRYHLSHPRVPRGSHRCPDSSRAQSSKAVQSCKPPVDPLPSPSSKAAWWFQSKRKGNEIYDIYGSKYVLRNMPCLSTFYAHALIECPVYSVFLVCSRREVF